MLKHYYKGIRKNGLLAEFQYLDSTSDFYRIPHDFSRQVSFDPVAAIIKVNARQFQIVANAFFNLKVFPLTSQFAGYSVVIHSIMMDSPGKKSEFDLVESGLLVKRSGGWKLFQGQSRLVGKGQN